MDHRHTALAAIALLTLIGCPQPTDDDESESGLEFADAALEACVRDAVDLGDEPVPEDVQGVRNLACQDAGITDLSGLEHFTGLQTLSLWENEVEDLAPLTGLTELTWLQLGNNEIRDLSPLAGLTRLERLGLSVNDVDDLDALADLDELRWLNLDRNELTDDDLEVLCGLPPMRWLTLEHNYVEDLSVIDCQIDEGCDVYIEFQDDESERSADTDALVPVNAITLGPAEPVPAGALALDVTDDGRVLLGYDLDGVRIDARPEFGGELVRDGRELRYRWLGLDVAVGGLTDNGWQLCEGAWADTCAVQVGSKHPAGGERHPAFVAAPVVSVSLVLSDVHDLLAAGPDGEMIPRDEDFDYHGYKDESLAPYVFASPNQYDAGSCLFMATTGTVEVLMNQHADPDAIDYWGDTDLSERFLMGIYTDAYGAMNYFLTDLVYTYNVIGGSMLDRDYPFAAGYVKDSFSGVVEASPNDSGAYFSCYYSWLDLMPDNWDELLVETPRADRTTIFTDPDRDDNSYWAVALADHDTVEMIKYELRTRKAPVIVVYNHYLYWHANIVVGYDDSVPTGGCSFVEDSVDYFSSQGANSYAVAIENHIDDLGGCMDHGVFYVRDSIYDGTDAEQDYVYSEQYGFEDKYSQRIVMRSYDWVTALANHAFVIHRR